MHTQIQIVKMASSEALTAFTLNKISKLTAKFNRIYAIDIYFKKENTPAGPGSICAIECSIPGQNIFASTSKNYFEHSVKVAISEIEKQLEKRKSLQEFY